MTDVIRSELLAYKKKYAVPRKTEITKAEEAVFTVKAPEERDLLCLVDRFGYAKTMDASMYEKNKEVIDQDFRFHFICKSTGKICVFTNVGNLHTIRVQDIPNGKLKDRGIPIDNISNYSSDKETVVYITSQSSLNLYRLLFVTKKAMMKVVSGGEFDVTRRMVAATSLNEGDELISVAVLTDQQTVVLQSRGGFFLRFAIEEVPEKKKGAAGMRGMKLADNDELTAVYFTGPSDKGSIEYHEKTLEINRLKIAGRDGKGTRQK